MSTGSLRGQVRYVRTIVSFVRMHDSKLGRMLMNTRERTIVPPVYDILIEGRSPPTPYFKKGWW